MGRTLIEHTYDDTTVTNPDGSARLELDGATTVDGPGDTALGTFDTALDLADASGGVADLSDLDVAPGPFSVRVVLEVGDGLDEAQAVVASDLAPFELQVLPGEDDGARLAANLRHGDARTRAATRFSTPLSAGTWHVVDLVADADALVLAVDGEVVAVHAIVDGTVEPGDGRSLAVGTGLDDDAGAFTGRLATLQVVEGIPDDLATAVDAAHDDPAWFISHKVASIRDRLDLGRPNDPAHLDDAIGAWVQPHQHGTVMYQPAAGVAFEFHGGIHDHWQSLDADVRGRLGPLLGDEEDTRVGGGRRSLFRGGSINWVRGSGAVVLTGAIFRDWELTDAPDEIGLPVADREEVDGGHVQRFRHGRMYHRDGQPHAHWVKGAILDRYLDTGGLDAWGFPTSDERDVMDAGPPIRVGGDGTRRRDHRDDADRGDRDQEHSGPRVRDHRDRTGDREEDTGPRVRDHRERASGGSTSATTRVRDRREAGTGESRRARATTHAKATTRAKVRDHRTTTAVRGRDADTAATTRRRRRRDPERDETDDLPDLPDRPDRPESQGGDDDGGTRPRRVVGKVSTFEDATIWWSGRTGARVLHGPIAQRYDDRGGPTGPLGFPTTSVQDIDPKFDPAADSSERRPAPPSGGGGSDRRRRRPDGPGEGGVVIKAAERGETSTARAVRSASPDRAAARRARPRPGEPDLPDLPDVPTPPGDGDTGGGTGTGGGADPTSPGLIASFERGSIVDLDGVAGDPLVVPPLRLFLDTLDTDESERIGMGQNDLHAWVTVEVDGERVHHERHPGPDDTWGDENVVDLSLTLPVRVTPDEPDREVELTIDVRDSDPGSDDHLGIVSWRLHPGNAWGLAIDDGILHSGATDKLNDVVVSVKPKVDADRLSHEQKFWGTGNRGSDAIDWDEFAVAFPQADSEPEWYDPGDWFVRAFHELFVEDLAKPGNCVGMSLEAIHARKGSSAFGLPLDRFDDWSVLEEAFNIRHAYQLGHAPIDWFLAQFVTGNTHDPRDVFKRTREEARRGNHPVLCVTKDYDFGGDPHCVLPVAWDDSSDKWVITISDPSIPQDLQRLEVDPDDNSFQYRDYDGGSWTGGRLHYLPFDVLDRPQRVPSGSLLQLLGGAWLGLTILISKAVDSVSLRAPDGIDLDATGGDARRLLQDGTAPEGTFLRYRGFDLGDRRAERGTGDPVQGQLWFQLGDPDREGAGRPSPRDYHHELVGLDDGGLDYVVDDGHAQVRVRTDLAEDEPAAVEAAELGSPRQQLTLRSERDKEVSLDIVHQLGSSGDRMRVSVADLPTSSDRPLQLNVKPGLAGMDLVGAAGRVDAPVEVEATVDGNTTLRRFTVDLDGGTRLRPASAASGAELATARIDRLFAPSSTRRAVEAE